MGPRVNLFGSQDSEANRFETLAAKHVSEFLHVAVASEEETRQGVNPWKRERLIRAGADLIIADYRCQQQLLELLGLSPFHAG